MAGQIRTWWPHCAVAEQPLSRSIWLLLRVGSLHSRVDLERRTHRSARRCPAPTRVPGVVLARQDRLAVDTLVGEHAVEVLVEALVCQKNVAVLPWVWNAASCRTVTGWVVLARSQYGLRTSSPLALHQPLLVQRLPGRGDGWWCSRTAERSRPRPAPGRPRTGSARSRPARPAGSAESASSEQTVSAAGPQTGAGADAGGGEPHLDVERAADRDQGRQRRRVDQAERTGDVRAR